MLKARDAASHAPNRGVPLAVRARPLSARRTLVAVEGDLDLATAPRLKTTLIEALDAGYREIVLDLSAVGHMDSTGLAVLIGVRERLKDDGRLVLAAVPRNVLAVLDVTGLTSRFDLVPTVQHIAGQLEEAEGGGRRYGLTAEAEMALGLLATALPFAESQVAEADRWFRVLQSHGDSAHILSDLVAGEPAAPSADPPRSMVSSNASPLDGAERTKRVIERARHLATERGANVVGTVELLAAVVTVYGAGFDQVLRRHGTDRATMIKRLNASVRSRRSRL